MSDVYDTDILLRSGQQAHLLRRRRWRTDQRYRLDRSNIIEQVPDVGRINATNADAPSMRQRIDAADLHAKALRALPDTIGG